MDIVSKRSRRATVPHRVRILLSAFDPFGSHTVNASAEVARRIAVTGIRGATVRTVVLPVVRFEASRVLFEAFDELRPHAVVMLGIAESRSAVTPERVAVNVDDFRIPDNAGNGPVDEPIVPQAPAAYLSTLPIKRISEALTDSDIPADVSNTAGTFLCNHVFYAMMHRIATTDSTAIAGFVHIPQMSEAREDAGPSLPLDTLVRGIRLTLATVASAVVFSVDRP